MTSNITKRVRLRFLVLIPLVLVCVLIARAHILNVGGTQDVLIDIYPGTTLTEENITLTPPDVCTISSITQDDAGNTHITFEAGEPASGMCLISVEESGMMFQIVTTPEGVIVANGLDITGWEAAFAALIVILIAVAVLCTSAFITLKRQAWYGYEMAAYAGGAIFFFAQTLIILVFYLLGGITSFSTLAMVITSMASTFVNVATLPVAVLLLLVGASNAVLLRREGVGFTNLLGVFASLAWGLAVLGLWWFHNNLAMLITNPYVYVFSDSAISGIVAYAVALFLGTCVTALLAAHHTPAHPRDYLVILGCALRKDGTPTPLLSGRADAAIAYARTQTDAGFDAPAFVPCGGQGSDEVCSEAASMASYLKKHVTNPRILLEDRSTTTHENMSFSAEVIAADGAAPDAPVAFATTNYHVLRGYVFAHEAGLAAEGIAAPTKLYFWPNAFLREFVGMLAAHAALISVNCAAIVALYLVAEYLLLMQ